MKDAKRVCSKCGSEYLSYVGYDVWGNEKEHGEVRQFACSKCDNIDNVGSHCRDGELNIIDERGVKDA